MNIQALQNFMNYLNRCTGIVPTTLAEAGAFNDVLVGLQQAASGQATIEVKPIVPAASVARPDQGQ